MCLNIVLYLLFQGNTPLHFAAVGGNTEVVDLLLKSGASPSVVDNMVIKHSVKLRESDIKLFKWRVILLLKQKMQRFMTLQKKMFMAAINSLNRLICYKEWRKYQTCRVASSFNCLIKWNYKFFISLIFVTIIDFFMNSWQLNYL